MDSIMGEGKTARAMDPHPGPTQGPVGMDAIPRDELLAKTLEETRSLAMDAARFHSRELVRAIRTVEACEHSGANGLAGPPSGERIDALIQEAVQEQSAPAPYVSDLTKQPGY